MAERADKRIASTADFRGNQWCSHVCRARTVSSRSDDPTSQIRRALSTVGCATVLNFAEKPADLFRSRIEAPCGLIPVSSSTACQSALQLLALTSIADLLAVLPIAACEL
jgi:hypothetical protein